MATEIDIADVLGRTITSWRFEEGRLLLAFADDAERPLRCVCGRCHWIVETRAEPGRPVLAVRCHGCGTAREFRIAGHDLPA